MEGLTVLFLFLVVLTILWALIPFAVFGIKPRLDRVVKGIADLGNWQGTNSSQLRAIEKQLERLDQGPQQPAPKSLKQQAAEIIRERKV